MLGGSVSRRMLRLLAGCLLLLSCKITQPSSLPDTVVGTIAVGSDPHSVACVSNGRYV